MFVRELIVALLLNFTLFFVAYLRKTDKLTDFAYGLTFIVIALTAIWGRKINASNIVLFLMIVIWALRLGSYLVLRIRKIGRDSRFDEFRNDFLKFGGFWMLQAISAWIIMLPAVYFLSHTPGDYSGLMMIGVVVWGAGIIIESVADAQKYSFNNNPKNKGKWIATGIWSKSRHPNYFGEILIWFGTYLYAATVLSPIHTLLALISPLWISSLIVFVSGIPKLEDSADARWGNDPAYKKYKAETPVLIPKL